MKFSPYFISVFEQVAISSPFPKEVTIEDKTAVAQINLIAQLEKEARQTHFKLIDKMLTNKKYKDTFSRKMWRYFKDFYLKAGTASGDADEVLIIQRQS